MNREHVLYLLFALLVCIATLHFVGVERFWYWQFWWFDLVTHFLFGLWTGLFVLWFAFLSGYFGSFSLRGVSEHALGTLFVVGVIGIGWEIFGVWAGVPIKEGHAFDTALDLLMDILGALAAYLFFRTSWILTQHN